MAALTSGTETPDFGHRRGGCCGCYAGWGGCYGGYGCHHGGYYGAYGWGGCYSFGCWGCWCSGSGGYGGYGGWGGCHGGGWGCAGGGYGCYASSIWSCTGCYGGWSGYSMPYAGMPYTQGVPVGPGGTVVPEQLPKPGKGEGTSTRGRLVVEVPEDATLYIDDQPMKTKAARRVFKTPPLDRTQTYYYILRAEVTRDGRPLSETVRVLIRPGQEAYATFPTLAPATVQTAQR
jgi:uncharacterized protein (TIGR03000 family)